MSGEYYKYTYTKVLDFVDDLQRNLDSKCAIEHGSSRELREAFAQHLVKVAAALKAIEWNDSLDGHTGEAEAIKVCLSMA